MGSRAPAPPRRHSPLRGSRGWESQGCRPRSRLRARHGCHGNQQRATPAAAGEDSGEKQETPDHYALGNQRLKRKWQGLQVPRCKTEMK